MPKSKNIEKQLYSLVSRVKKVKMLIENYQIFTFLLDHCLLLSNIQTTTFSMQIYCYT